MLSLTYCLTAFCLNTFTRRASLNVQVFASPLCWNFASPLCWDFVVCAFEKDARQQRTKEDEIAINIFLETLIKLNLLYILMVLRILASKIRRTFCAPQRNRTATARTGISNSIH